MVNSRIWGWYTLFLKNINKIFSCQVFFKKKCLVALKIQTVQTYLKRKAMVP